MFGSQSNGRTVEMRNTDSVLGSALYSSRPRERRALRLSQSVLALLFLNFLTTFGNLWPSALIVPGARIGPEFIGLWVLILALVALFGHVGRRASLFLTLLFVLISIGRYAEVTMPALMGRPLNLYWDAPQLPRFLSVASQDLSGPGANWDVPVHIVTAKRVIAERLRRFGFRDGVHPERDPLGHISAIGPMLLSAFDSGSVRTADPGETPAPGPN